MAQTLKRGEKVLYSDGDEKWGSELVFVARRETTPSSDSTPKTVTCVKYKTLCDALKELAAIEKKKGTNKFIKEILDRDQLLRGELVIMHNPITGGGDPKDTKIEDTEFKDPRLPYFVDIEYVEVGYALSKQWINPSLMHGMWALLVKPIGRLIEGQKQKNPITDYNHRPNRLGAKMGRIIANNYKDLSDFTDKFCTDECSADESAALKEVRREAW